MTESIWKDSMRIGIPIFDEQRKDLTNIIEMLDTSPDHEITDEYFLGRFSVLQVTISEFFTREESLMEQLGVPAGVMYRIKVEHDELLDLFNQVYLDSMAGRRRTAREVYLTIRDEFQKLMTGQGHELRQYVKDHQ